MGHTLAAGGWDGSIKLWDSRPSPIATPASTTSNLLGHCWGLALSPDGRVLATVGKDGQGRLTDVKSGKDLHLLDGNHSPQQAVAFSRDGAHLVTAGADGVIRLWDTRNGRFLRVLKGQDGSVRHVASSPEGDRLATAGSDGTIRLWDSSGKAPEPSATLRGHDRFVNAVSFAGDGRSLASGGYDGMVRVWDKPEDLPIRIETGKGPASASPALGAEDGFATPYKSDDGPFGIFLFVDGSVKPIHKSVSAGIFAALLTSARGEVIPADVIGARKTTLGTERPSSSFRLEVSRKGDSHTARLREVSQPQPVAQPASVPAPTPGAPSPK